MEHGILQSRQKKEKKISKPENIFLVIATVLGLTFALLQPLFIEPDSSYHFDHAMYISNTVVDRAKIGFPAEDYQSAPVPFDTVSTMMKEGTYFKNFFETKLPLISQKEANPRVSAGYGKKWNLTWYNDVMHIVPALGVKLGYMIYPSVGSMEITARIFSLIFFIVSMFFIIKKLKAYKMFFVAISLTPTIIQTATSLSYDCYNYVASAFMIMAVINLAVDIQDGKEIKFKSFILRILAPSVTLYFTKVNSKLLYLIIPALLIYLIGKKLKISLSKIQLILGTIGALFLAFIFFCIKYSSHLDLIGKKLFYSFIEPYYTVLTTEVISGTNTNGIPAWLFPIQCAVLILLLLSYEKKRVPDWFAWGAFGVAVLNLFAVLISFAINPDFVDYENRIITGAQGRYFTPFLLLLPPIFSILATKITVKSGTWLKRTVILVSVLVLVFNLGITSIKFYHLQLPADEYRSGISHYIFK